MLTPTPDLDALERRHAREALAGMSYHEALARFAALWVHARKLNPNFPADWEADLEADLTLARVLNGLPPDS